MVKEFINRVIMILGILILLYIGVTVVIKTYDVEKVKIVTDNAWTNYTDNNEFTVDIDKLRKDNKNNDIQGFLRIDELDLYSILTKTSDNEYYLYHDIKDSKNDSGHPFIDFKNKSLDDDIILVYSKTSNAEMNKLAKLFNRDLFNKEIVLNLYMGNEASEYELLAVKMTDQLVDSEELIKQEYTIYHDTTDTIEEKTIEDEEEVEEVEEEKSISNILLSDNKYCKENCTISPEDNILVIELRNEELNHSNIVVIAKKIVKE